ncbi:MAG: nucleoside 2-deoxyribosyltransferase [Janthinobacterium lividum]
MHKPLAADARPLTIYLAGPDVFRVDAIEHGRRLTALCEAYGFSGLYPLDVELAKGAAETSPDALEDAPPDPRHAQAQAIYRANIGLLRSADLLMANLQHFRGPEPDSGTVFEVGFAVALGKPVWGYGVPSGKIVDHVPRNAQGRDAHGYLVEDFGHGRNLMLAVPVSFVAGDAAACLAAMREHYRGARAAAFDAGR